MSRGLSAANLAAAKAYRNRPAFFAEFDFVDGIVRFWTGSGTFTINGDLFQGLGVMGPISGIQETMHLEARAISFSLSGVPTSLIAAVLAEGNRGRPCKLWQGFLNESRTALVDDPILRFVGRMDQLKISEQGETSTITIPAESLLALLTRARPYRLSHQEQQRRFPGDLGLEYLVQTATRTLTLGSDDNMPPPYRLARNSPKF